MKKGIKYLGFAIHLYSIACLCFAATITYLTRSITIVGLASVLSILILEFNQWLLQTKDQEELSPKQKICGNLLLVILAISVIWVDQKTDLSQASFSGQVTHWLILTLLMILLFIGGLSLGPVRVKKG